MIDFRYYRGEIKCDIIIKGKKKAYIMYLECGRIGNKTEGYKNVYKFDRDIVPIRMCWRNRK